MKRMMMICLQGIGAGLAISIGGTVYLSVEQPVVGSVLFAVGLYAIVLNGLYLYTGKVGYLVEQEKPAPYLMLLLATWTGNLLGTAAGAALILQTRVGSGLKERVQGICQTKLGPLILIFCVSVFILCGFEHCIANMFYFSLAGVWSAKTFGYLLVMTLGNSLGGMLIPALKRVQP